MNVTLKTLMTTLLLTGAGSVMAASSVDLSVRGLITPSACEPALSSGGVYDLGKISSKDLNPDKVTYLGEHLLQMTVTCDAATLMAIEPQDNRPGSSYDAMPFRFGLGSINAIEKLGYVEMWLTSMLADGVAGRPIGSTDGGLTWSGDAALKNDTLTSVADTATLVPLPVQVLTMDLNLAATIAPTNELTLTNEAPIDGSVTLTVKYL